MSVIETNSETYCLVCGEKAQVYIPSICDDRYGCPGSYHINRCPSCGYMATLPALTEGDLPALYSQYYPRRQVNYGDLQREADRVRAPFASLKRWAFGTNNQGHYEARPGQRVLDIGSGACLSLLELRAMGVEAFGVEADPNVEAIADHFGLNVHIGSIHDNPFPDVSFDLIVLNQVIEHVPDPLALLRQLKGRLSPGGAVTLSFPNVDSWQRRWSGNRWINWHVPYHQHHFNMRAFTLLATKAGYRVGRARSITPNLWTLLQLRAMGEAPEQGKASSGWAAAEKADEHTKTPGLLRRIRNKGMGLLVRSAKILFVIINRIIDFLGKGDSLLVTLYSQAAQSGR